MEINTAISRDSWMRRFIVCKFIKQCPFDMVNINYDDLKIRDLAAQMFRNKYCKLESEHTHQFALVKDLFNVYYEISLEDYACEKFDFEFDDIMEQSVEIVNKEIESQTQYTLMHPPPIIHELEIGKVKKIKKKNIKTRAIDPFEEEKRHNQLTIAP